MDRLFKMDYFEFLKVFPAQTWLTGVVLIGFHISLNSQVPINAAPNPAMGPESGPFESFAAEVFLTHLLNETATYRWTRTVIELQGGPECVTAVSDKNITYAPFLNSYTFEMEPNETDFPLFVYLLNPDTVPCCGLVHLQVNPEGDTTNLLTIVYVFGDCLSSTSETQPATVNIQPNPVRHTFSLSGATAGTTVQLFSAEGRLVRFWKPGVEQYSVEQLEAGNYVLVLLDEGGVPYRALKLVKE